MLGGAKKDLKSLMETDDAYPEEPCLEDVTLLVGNPPNMIRHGDLSFMQLRDLRRAITDGNVYLFFNANKQNPLPLQFRSQFKYCPPLPNTLPVFNSDGADAVLKTGKEAIVNDPQEIKIWLGTCLRKAGWNTVESRALQRR